ncbi:MAG: HPP family protein [Asticcacaulis sp.]
MKPSLRAWFDAFTPKQAPASWRERLIVVLGAFIGIAVTGLIDHLIARQLGLSVWLIAPIAASTVLVFGVPASPLGQPWPLVFGNTISAVVGLICLHLIPEPLVAAPVAVASAIFIMYMTRSLHPPGGAMALLIVLTHTTDPLFVLFPAFTSSAVLVAVGAAYSVVTKRNYPHVPVPPKPEALPAPISEADMRAALAETGTALDITPDELETLLESATRHSQQRLKTLSSEK